jgi:hypothetical protein
MLVTIERFGEDLPNQNQEIFRNSNLQDIEVGEAQITKLKSSEDILYVRVRQMNEECGKMEMVKCCC